MLQVASSKEAERLRQNLLSQAQKLEAAQQRAAELETQLSKKEHLIAEQKKFLEDVKLQAKYAHARTHTNTQAQQLMDTHTHTLTLTHTHTHRHTLSHTQIYAHRVGHTHTLSHTWEPLKLWLCSQVRSMF